MTHRLIALYSSAPRSGKTEVANALFDRGFQVFKFAGALKDMIKSLLRSAGHGEMEIEELLNGERKEEALPEFGGKTPRHLMQTLGTEWGRNLVSPYLWTDLLTLRVESALKAGHQVVVDDMRFPNEFDLLKGLGAVMVWVKRPGVVAKGGHPSEGLLDNHPFDREVPNNRDLKHLRSMVYDLI